MNERIHIVVANRHAALRKQIRRSLSHDAAMAIVAEAGDAQDTLHLVDRYAPQVVVLGHGLPGLYLRELIRQLKADAPHTRIVVLTGTRATPDICSLLIAGADGCVPAQDQTESLNRAVRAVAEGGAFLTQDVLAAVRHTLVQARAGG